MFVDFGQKKCYHAIRDGFPQLSQDRFLFLGWTPPAGRGDLVVFGPFWDFGTWRNSARAPTDRKWRFTGFSGPFWLGGLDCGPILADFGPTIKQN